MSYKTRQPPAVRELAEAIRLTREYVGADLLPAVEGWSWYDALRRWAPEYLPKAQPDTSGLNVGCAVLHKDRSGNTIPCPDRDAPDDGRCSNPDHQDPKKWPRNSRWCMTYTFGTPHPPHDGEAYGVAEHCDGRPERPSQRPPARLYEVRTVHGEVYLADGHDVQNTAGWFTLWADVATVALRLPEADVRSVRHVTEGELGMAADETAPTTEAAACCANGDTASEGPRCSDVPDCDGRCCKPRDKDQEIRSGNEVIERLAAEIDEARQWARHGYEIGQRHCGWTDHGVAPAWLTEGWPRHFDSCEHLKQAADFDTALTRVQALREQPEVMDAQQPHPDAYLHGYGVAIRDAKRAARTGPPERTVAADEPEGRPA